MDASRRLARSTPVPRFLWLVLAAATPVAMSRNLVGTAEINRSRAMDHVPITAASALVEVSADAINGTTPGIRRSMAAELKKRQLDPGSSASV
ncbi:hypothetical protein C8R44DRAFT_870080 [Mycena epipterygia]|nr:hypothetical protein C8R44DRAFT_870080 [Mycena epipterygia]